VSLRVGRGLVLGGLVPLAFVMVIALEPASATVQEPSIDAAAPRLESGLRGALFAADPSLLSAGRVGGRFSLDYAWRPLGRPSDATGVVLEGLASAGVAAAVGLHDRVNLFVEMSLASVAFHGPAMEVLGDPERRFSVGDLRLSVPVLAWQRAGAYLVVEPSLIFPTGSASIFLTGGTLRPGLSVAAGAELGAWLLGAQVATDLQVWPEAEPVAGWSAEDRLRATLHASVGLGAEGRLRVGVELLAQTVVGSERVQAFGARNSWSGGFATVRLPLVADLAAFGAVGAFGGQGAGASPVRALVGLELAPEGPLDVEGDGVPDRDDLCPERAEDLDGFEDADGCPDPDNDADGLADAVDRCPDAAEDGDGFEDADGCPDPDNDADGIPDERDDCATEAEDRDGFEDADGCPDPDNDGDGLGDGLERDTGTDPDAPDSDGDGLADGREDFDGDGAVGSFETDPRRADTDGDGTADSDDPCPLVDGQVAVSAAKPAGCPANALAGRFEGGVAPLTVLRFTRNGRLRDGSLPAVEALARLQSILPYRYRLVVHAPGGSEAWFIERSNSLLDALVRSGADPERLEESPELGPTGPAGSVFWLQEVD
jgi:hypothetical protein